jgi:NADH-quinone oxidoreductase subunit L
MLFSEVANNITPIFPLAPLLVFLPVIGLVVNLLLGKRLGEGFAGTIASLASGGSFVVALLMALQLARTPEAVTVPFLDWITIGDFTARWAFRVLGDDDAGRVGGRHADPHLCHRLHAR